MKLPRYLQEPENEDTECQRVREQFVPLHNWALPATFHATSKPHTKIHLFRALSIYFHAFLNLVGAQAVLPGAYVTRQGKNQAIILAMKPPRLNVTGKTC